MPRNQYINRLSDEKSPYLLQHAHNPVDWYPWGDEAFGRAVQENKPVFLSIGYSTCHWCHIMERESFEDLEVAQILNRDFVSVKVDREERPDIDTVYMNVCQGMTGQGGWPLTIIMTPDKKPFFAGTYIPKQSRGGLTGLMDLLPRLAGIWQEEPEACFDAGDRIKEWLEQSVQPAEAPGEINRELFDKAFEHFARNYDAGYGGFGSAPKFPTPHQLLFLLRYWFYTHEPRALEMVEKTLRSMYRGGIYDHIGFGFSRYATDRAWLVPHFEKMLYDNALLVTAFLETYQATGDKLYARVAGEIFTYVLRDMNHKEGGFFSAEDADSEGEEGKFYVWTVAEVLEALGELKGIEFCGYYGITPGGNFAGQSIPNLVGTDFSEERRQEMEPLRQALYEYRLKRIRPFKDDKVLLSWNGLMIAALALGGRVLDEPLYLQKARDAVDFIETHMRIKGRYLRRYRQGEAGNPAFAADYAAYVWGLLEMYRSTLDSWYLQKALEVNREMIDLFWDETEGGLFYYARDNEELLVNPKEVYDGAIPSPNSLAARNLVWLSRLTADEQINEKAERILPVFSASLTEHPWAHTYFLLAAMPTQFSNHEVVIVGEVAEQGTRDMIRMMNQLFSPDTTLALKQDSKNDLNNLITYTEDMRKVDEKATAYVCSGYSCQEPVIGAAQLYERLAPHQPQS